MNQEKYLEEFKYLKVVMMLFIVLYHSVALWLPEGWFNQAPATSNKVFTLLAQWLNFIHIYVFVFISGYIFYYLKIVIRKYNKFSEFVRKKTLRLIVPYISFGILWCIPFYVLFYHPSFHEIIKNYLFGYGPAQLWYILMLFFLFIMVYYPSKYLIKLKGVNIQILCVSLYMLYIVGSVYLKLPFQLWSVCKFMPFFILGMSLRKYDYQIMNNYMCIILLCINLVMLYIYIKMPENTIIYSLLRKIVAYFISYTGILEMITINHRLQYLKIWSTRLYKVFEKNSFAIYLIHQQIIWCVVTALNSKVSSVILAICNVTISCSLSILLAEFLRKNKITSLFIGEKQFSVKGREKEERMR